MDNEQEQGISETARAVKNPNKGFVPSSDSVEISKNSVENNIVDDDNSDVSISNVSADEFDRKAFGRQLRNLRGQLSRREVAIGARVSAPALLLWEKGSSEPTASKIINLCKFFGISSDELLGLSINPKKEEKPEQPSEPVNPPEPKQAVQPSEPESPSPSEQAKQSSEPEPQTQPSMPMCKDCPLMSTVQSLSSAVALALSRR